MGRLGQAKTLGGVGSILELIPGVSIVGYILTLIAVNYISDELQDRTIFNNMLYAVITGIVGVFVGAVLLFGGLASSALTLGVSALVGIFSFLAIIWVVLIISSIFVRRAFDAMATKLNVGSFRTAGTLYLIGALLTIVLVGFIILLVAYIFQIIAFFSINEMARPGQATPSAAPSASMTSPSRSAGKKFCPNCGAELDVSAAFCPRCGQKQPV